MDGTGEYADKITVYEYFEANGLQGAALRGATLEWSQEHALNGVSWVYVRLHQPEYGNDLDDRFWSRFPNLEFLVRGSRLTWPGQAVPTWTRNAASWRYWYDTVFMGRPAAIVDNSSFQSARAVCGQVRTVALPQDYLDEGWDDQVMRYAVDGWIYTDADPSQVKQELDFCWQGFAVEFMGKLYYRPGVARPPVAVIDGDAVILARGEFTPEPDLNERINAVTGGVAQSSQHDYTRYSLPEIRDAPAIARDGQVRTANMGNRELVADPITAAVGATILLRRSRAALVLQNQITPGRDLEYLDLMPTDLIVWSDSRYGIAAQTYQLLNVAFAEDWSLHLEMQLWAADTYDDTLLLPPLPNLLSIAAQRPDPDGRDLRRNSHCAGGRVAVDCVGGLLGPGGLGADAGAVAAQIGGGRRPESLGARDRPRRSRPGWPGGGRADV